MSDNYFIGVDLGGTNIVSALVTAEGKLLIRDRRPTHARKGKEFVLQQIKESIRTIFAESQLPAGKIVAIGIGSPGPLNTRTGVVISPSNLPGWYNVPLKEIIQREFSLPVYLDNDANAAAQGEKWLGAGWQVNDLVCLTLGTGVGGGIILGGKIFRGIDDTGGEIGHMILVPNGRRCNCGNMGCLEAYASATAIVERTYEFLQAGKNSSLQKAIARGGEFSASLIYEHALQGDTLSCQIMEETGRYLGIAIASLVNILNPEMVVICGGVSQAGEMIFRPLREEVKIRALQVPAERVKIVSGILGDNAGVIGAAYVALQGWREER